MDKPAQAPASLPARTDWTGADDLTLVHGLLKHDQRVHERAWREFDRRYRTQIRARVKATVQRTLAARRDLDDIVSEVMCALLADDCAALRNFDPARATLEAYVLLFAKCRALDYVDALRARVAGQQLDSLEALDDDNGGGALWIAGERGLVATANLDDAIDQMRAEAAEPARLSQSKAARRARRRAQREAAKIGPVACES